MSSAARLFAMYAVFAGLSCPGLLLGQLAPARADGLREAGAAVAADTLIGKLQERLSLIAGIEVSPLSASQDVGGFYTPTAYGSAWGYAGVGLGLQGRSRYGKNPDGAAGLSLGLGSPRSVGLDVGVVILDLRPNVRGEGGFGRRGSFSLKLHHTFPSSLAVAAGVENVLNWGGTDVPPSSYAVVSRQFRLKELSSAPFSRASVSLGMGNGRFRTAQDLRTDGKPLGVFASGSLAMLPSLGGYLEWTGQDLGGGLSVHPIRSLPLVVTPGLTDITGVSGYRARLVLGLGYGFTFR